MTLSPMPRNRPEFGALESFRSIPALITTCTSLRIPTMLLRFESPNGQFRLSVEPNDTFSSLTSKVGFHPKAAPSIVLIIRLLSKDQQILDHLPPKTDASSIILSNKPIGHSAGEER